MSKLLAQAVRVYLANQRQGTQSALTRAEVNRTKKKWYRQKGTGRARHGDRKAPIFVGGGVAFAPQPRDYSLKLPQKMRQQAISLALKAKKVEKINLDKVDGKTKSLAKLLDLSKPALLITKESNARVWQAGRNLANLTILPRNQLNVFAILKAHKIYEE